MSLKYKNKMVINQRGGSIDIDNSTDNEKVQISQRSGSNINITSVVTSELATNNKQLHVINDSFETIGNNSTIFISKDKTERIGENSYNLKGFSNNSEIEAFQKWKAAYKPIADKNSQFKINRGGIGYPNGSATPRIGSRSSNPVLTYVTTAVDNTFGGYYAVPIRNSLYDGVANYAPVPDRVGTGATPRTVSLAALSKAAASAGSHGGAASAATENGAWGVNPNASNLANDIIELQDTLIPIEQSMGNGGDDITFIKRNKIETVGAAFNDFASIRVDPQGRSQPSEVLVGDTGAFKNHTAIPVVEDVDNSSIFPGGTQTTVVGNKQNITIGSGGYNLKTTGSIELGGTSFKGGFKKCNISASYGIHLLSESIVELTSLKNITLRTNNQVLIESALGVKNNAVIGGGIYTEGELYVHHVTAPVEIQQTEDTVLYGKFDTLVDRKLVIGEVFILGGWRKVYALSKHNLIVNYSHSHHFRNIPIRLCGSNSDVRKLAQGENINSHGSTSPALPQVHQKKPIVKVS